MDNVSPNCPVKASCFISLPMAKDYTQYYDFHERERKLCSQFVKFFKRLYLYKNEKILKENINDLVFSPNLALI